MLNLSEFRVLENVSEMNLSALEQVSLPTGQRLFRRWLLGMAIIGIGILLMPWVQNIRAKGKVTTLNPAYRPQTVHATFPGRIEHWYVFEGDTIQQGDTIARLSETKSEYLDPQIVERTGISREAKSNSANGYLAKAEALADQITSLREEQKLKQEQAENKYEQQQLYVATLEAKLIQQETEVSIAEYQMERSDSLYRSGLKPLTDLEGKRLKVQEARAKYTTLSNELEQATTEVAQTILQLETVGPSYRNKLAKAESDRQSAVVSYYESIGEVAKLSTQESNYRIRADYRYVVAPQGGIVNRVLKPGIGETVKAGDAVVSILPVKFVPAVEIFVAPYNLPLIRPGLEVRFLFDGWPAIFFSGWPGLSYGTFIGEVVSIDNDINNEGLYRILVKPSTNGRPWPKELRPGSGAEGVALLGKVTVWYELWRQLNAFPPNYYQDDKEKDNEPKLKTPAKRVIK